MDSKFTDKLIAISSKLAQNRVLQTIQTAFMQMMIITMIGGIAALLKGIDFGGYQAWLQSTPLFNALGAIYQFTIGFLGIYVAFLVAYSFPDKYELRCSKVVLGLTSLVCFMVVTPYTVGEGFDPSMIPTSWLGASGMFTAILVSFICGFIFMFCEKKNIRIELPDAVPPMIGQQFTALIPSTIAIALAALLSVIFSYTSFGSVQQVVYSLISAPLAKLGSNIFGFWLLMVILYACWFFGIHGGMTVGPIIMMLFMQLQMENLAAFQAGQALPNMVTGSNLSFSSGSLPLVIAALIFAKSEQNKAISRLGALPAFMGVDEPMYFGMPMILNPVFFIPWVLIVPTLSVWMTYLLNLTGLLPYATGASAGSFVPFFVANAVSYGWKGVFWGMVQMVLCVLVYVPFFKAYDNQKCAEEAAAANKN